MYAFRMILSFLVCFSLGFFSEAEELKGRSKFETQMYQMHVSDTALFTAVRTEWAFNKAKSGEEIFSLVEPMLRSNDKRGFKYLTKQIQKIPKVLRHGNLIQYKLGGRDFVVDFRDVANHKIRINGIEWSYNPKLDLVPQLESLRKKLSPSEVSIFNFLIPRAEAAEPITTTAVAFALAMATVGTLYAIFGEPLKDFTKPSVYSAGCRFLVYIGWISLEPKEILEADLKDYPSCAGTIGRMKAQKPGEKAAGPLPDSPASIQGFSLDWGKTCPKPDALVSLNVYRPGEQIQQRIQLTKKGDESVPKWIIAGFKKTNSNGVYDTDPERPGPLRFDMEDGHLNCISPVDTEGKDIDLTSIAGYEKAIIKKKVCLSDILKEEKDDKTLEIRRGELAALKKAISGYFLPHTTWSKIMIDQCGTNATPAAATSHPPTLQK